MTRILGISGSLRKGSFNTALLRTAVTLAPDGVELDARTIHGVPLYDADVERDGVPEAVTALREGLAAADGLLLVTPEYNNSMPGVFKNAIDWMSSGPGGALFRGKPVALIGASPGPFGTTQSQTNWLPVIRTLGMSPWFEGRLMVSRAREAFDESGTLTDARIREKLAGIVAGFAEAIAGGKV